MYDIRMIAMDLDGTFLQRDGSVLPKTLEALKKAWESGIILALASGRYPENASLAFLDNGLDGPVIGANGAMITDRAMGQTLFLHMMPHDTVMAVRDMLESLGAEYLVFSHKLVATSRPDFFHHSELNDGPRIARLGGVRFTHGRKAIDEAVQYGVCKFFIYTQPKLREIAEHLRGIDRLVITRSGEQNIELMPAGIDKGTGLKEMAKRYGISIKQVMAFGDEENDLPMLTQVGFGVAMGNAPEHVKAQCAYSTASFDQNGIAQAVECCILNK